jgi:hypothetical protein
MKMQVVDEISRYMDLDRDDLLEQGVEAFLRDHKRRLKLDRHQILTRYHVSNFTELEEKIRCGELEEHPTWEDLITLENIEEALQRLDAYLRDLHPSA